MGKAAAGGRPSAPGSGARPQPVPALTRGAGARPTSRCWWHLPKCGWKPEARVKFLRRIEDRSKRGSSKHVFPPERDHRRDGCNGTHHYSHYLASTHSSRGAGDGCPRELVALGWSTEPWSAMKCSVWRIITHCTTLNLLPVNMFSIFMLLIYHYCILYYYILLQYHC